MAGDATLLYLSTRKLDVEPGASRLPVWRRALNALSWIAPRLTVGIGVSVKVPRQHVSDVQRVHYFWEWLKRNDQVGTIDDPKAWFEGSHRVRYQTFTQTNPPVIWFSGETERTLFHLGGATRHLLVSQAPVPASDTPLSLLETDVARTLTRTWHADLKRPPEQDPLGDEAKQWVVDLEEIWRFSVAPDEEVSELECQFLAKRERYDVEKSSGSRSHLLGSLLLVTYRGSSQ